MSVDAAEMMEAIEVYDAVPEQPGHEHPSLLKQFLAGVCQFLD